jgi:hypothetical protein
MQKPPGTKAFRAACMSDGHAGLPSFPATCAPEMYFGHQREHW